ncbi:MAG: hypothetical protein OXG95_00255 [Chloroflexi bacterium]|nr:hypothetical protein [Chloroflexota bacterium]
MNVFAVFHENPREDPFDAQIHVDLGDNVYTLSDRLLLIRAPDEVPDSIAERMGFTRESGEADPAAQRLGVVFKLNASHLGFYHSGLWDWLREAREIA